MNALLERLCEPAGGEPAPELGVSPLALPERPAVAKMRYSHQAMAKVIAANPAISQNELAALFGYTASWVSRVMSTDAFRCILAEEMKDMPFTAEMRTNTRLQIEALFSRSLEVLAHKLDKRPEDIPDQLAIQTAKMASTVLEEKAPPASPAEVHVHLESLGKNLVGLLRRERAVIEAELVEEGERK